MEKVEKGCQCPIKGDLNPKLHNVLLAKNTTRDEAPTLGQMARAVAPYATFRTAQGVRTPHPSPVPAAMRPLRHRISRISAAIQNCVHEQHPWPGASLRTSRRRTNAKN